MSNYKKVNGQKFDCNLVQEKKQDDEIFDDSKNEILFPSYDDYVKFNYLKTL